MFTWDQNSNNSFQRIKGLFENLLLKPIQYYNRNKPVILQCDASLKGLGACILQDGKPIAFTSKSLTDTETRYANIEWELLAIVFGCKKFHTYLYGSSFVVESDHKPLEMICLKNLISAPVRLQRMLLRLQQYDMVIMYWPGKEMLLTDALSHLPSRANNTEIKLDLQVDAISFAFSSSWLTKTATETQKDPILSTLHWLTLNGLLWVWRHVPRVAHNYWDFWDEFSIEGDLLMKDERIIIPTSCRDSILANLHRSHEGVNRSLSLAKMCHLLARNGSWCDGLHQTVCDMHRQHEDFCRNLTSTWSPSQTMDQDRYGFLPRWFRTEIFNCCRLFLQVSIHLPCHIDTPPKDAEIPARSVFDRRLTSCRHDRQWTTLQQWRISMLCERIRLQAPDVLTALPSIKWIHQGNGQESQSCIQENRRISECSSESPTTVTWHPNRARLTRNFTQMARTRSCHALMSQTRQHPENLLQTTRNSTDAEMTLWSSSPSQRWESSESERTG